MPRLPGWWRSCGLHLLGFVKNFVKKTSKGEVNTPMMTEIRRFSRKYSFADPSNRSKSVKTRRLMLIMPTNATTNRKSVFYVIGVVWVYGLFFLTWRKKEMPVNIATIMVPVIASLPYGPEGGCMSIINEAIRHMMLRINPALNNFFRLFVFILRHYFLWCCRHLAANSSLLCL